MAFLASLITNLARQVYREKGKSPKMTSPVDYMPDWANEMTPVETKKQTPDEMREIFKAIASVQGRKKKQIK